MTRLLVTGSRKWTDRALIFEVLDAWHAVTGIDELIEGCARGADSIAEDWARERGIPLRHYPADWEHLGKRAGVMRNSAMLIGGQPEVVIAFHDDLRNSAGTGDMVHKAEKARVPVIRVVHEAGA